MQENINQNPEQITRDNIDKQLSSCGWIIQSLRHINLHAGIGVAVREYLTDVGPADYVLFVAGKPCGVIEAKREEEGHRMAVHESQAESYATAKLKHLNNEALPFVYVSTGEITKFTDFTDPKPQARELFSFQRPEITGKTYYNYSSEVNAPKHRHPFKAYTPDNGMFNIRGQRLPYSGGRYPPGIYLRATWNGNIEPEVLNLNPAFDGKPARGP